MNFPINDQIHPNISSLSSTQPLETQKSTSQEISFKTPEQFKEHISQALCSRKPFKDTSVLITQELEKQCPNETAKLTEFKNKYPEMMKELQELGWAGLKSKYKDEMKQIKENGMSYEQLRKVLVDATIDLSLAAVKQMGYSDPGSHAAFGTPGWPSDVDTTYFPGKDVPQEVQALEKLIFDAIMLGHFESLPGRLLDTESYIGQKGGPFAIEHQLRSTEAKQNYSFLELTLAMTQIHEGRAKEEWELYKGDQLKNAEHYSIQYKNNLDEILSDVESFKNEVSFQIEELAVQLYRADVPLPPKGSEEYEAAIHRLAQQLKHDEPESYRKAAISYRGSALIGLSAAMDNNLKEIDKYNIQLKAEQELLQKEISLGTRASPERIRNLQNIIENLEKKVEAARIEFSKQGGLRNLCFDEGYITYGALIVVVAKWGSQSAQRKLDNVGSMAEERFLRHQASQSLTFTPEQKKLPTPQELISSQQENLGFYGNHFEHDKGQTVESAKKAFVKNSKYCDRIFAACSELLKLLEKKTGSSNVPKTKQTEFAVIHQNVIDLKTEVQQQAFQASEVEKCKRRTELNLTAATELLTREFEKFLKEQEGVEDLGASQREDLQKDAEEIASLFQQLSSLAKKDSEQLPTDTSVSDTKRLGKFETEYVKKTFDHRERYNILMSKVIDKINYQIKTSNPIIITSSEPIIITNNDRINTLIRGMAGFPVVTKRIDHNHREVEEIDVELNKLFNEAEGITLAAFHLDTQEGIQKFNDNMAETSQLIRNLSYHTGVVASPENALAVGNLHPTWQKAILYTPITPKQ